MAIAFDNKIEKLVEMKKTNPDLHKICSIVGGCPSCYGLLNSNCKDDSCEDGSCVQCWENALEIAKQ